MRTSCYVALANLKFSDMSQIQAITTAASGLAKHPQDHGWRDLYELFAYGIENSAPHLTALLSTSYKTRPVSATHLVTLLGIAIKTQVSDYSADILGDGSMDLQLQALESVIEANSTAIAQILQTRQNSFTCARRFLVPQVILSAVFATDQAYDLRFADFGTGLGILPRQINSRVQFDKFAADLRWPGGTPAFRELRLAAVFGLDRGPLPDANWVRACYGISPYYESLYQELLFALQDQSSDAQPVQVAELDLLDIGSVSSFIREERINAANLSYVLYELDLTIRDTIVDAIADALSPPALLIVTEPSRELHAPGCGVTIYWGDSPDKVELCFVSDGHFKGTVRPLAGYNAFVGSYPIRYGSPDVTQESPSAA